MCQINEITATINNRWINALETWKATKPRIHATNKIIASSKSMFLPPKVKG